MLPLTCFLRIYCATCAVHLWTSPSPCHFKSNHPKGSGLNSLSSWSLFTGLFSCLSALWNLAEMGLNTLWLHINGWNQKLLIYSSPHGGFVRVLALDKFLAGTIRSVMRFVSLIVFLQNPKPSAVWKSYPGNVQISHRGEQNRPSTRAFF